MSEAKSLNNRFKKYKLTVLTGSGYSREFEIIAKKHDSSSSGYYYFYSDDEISYFPIACTIINSITVVEDEMTVNVDGREFVSQEVKPLHS